MNLEPLYELIRRFEGLRSKPYLCPAGVWTIGYGTTKNVTKNHPAVSVQQAELMMRADALGAYSSVTKVSPVLLPRRGSACAMADFVYNLGMGRYRASTLRRKVDSGEWESVPEQLRKWVWGGGKKLPGLVLRRQAEILLLSKDT